MSDLSKSSVLQGREACGSLTSTWPHGFTWGLRKLCAVLAEPGMLPEISDGFAVPALLLQPRPQLCETSPAASCVVWLCLGHPRQAP